MLALLAGGALAVALVCTLAVAAGSTIDTVAGSAAGGLTGDGGPATAAGLSGPTAIAPNPGGGYLIADTGDNVIRRVDAGGTITTVAGTGTACANPATACGDGGAATSAQLNAPEGVVGLPGGGFVVADTMDNRLRIVDGSGNISALAGDGIACNPLTSCGDDGASTVRLSEPRGLILRASGRLLVADTKDQRIRQVTITPFAISTVAGDGNQCTVGSCGNGGAPTAAQLSLPTDVSELASHTGFLIADTATHTIRKVEQTAGTINVVAGVLNDAGTGGDGGPAIVAKLAAPQAVLAQPDGGFIFSDTLNARVRSVSSSGSISTFAGTSAGFSGDGGDPALAQLSNPRGLAPGPQSGIYVVDKGNNRVRLVLPATSGGGGGGGGGGSTTTSDTTTVAPSGGDEPPSTTPDEPLVPTLDRALLAAPATGSPRIRFPGSSAFVPLPALRRIPVGADIDATSGSVQLVAELPSGDRATATVSGRFRIEQRARDGLVDLRLSAPIRGCPSARSDPGSSGAQLRRVDLPPVPSTRKVRVDARGPFRTDGRYGSAIVRGTAWTITDLCGRGRASGTRVTVARGLVAVRDFARRRTTLVPTGRSVFSRAR